MNNLDHPVNITEETLEAIPAYREYQPTPRRLATTTEPADDTRYWFVGAAYHQTDDRSSEFVQQGIWRNGNTDKYTEDVNSMQPGERIAIKAAYTRKRDLPFDNKGNPVSVLGIKATGTITRTIYDVRGLTVSSWTGTNDARATDADPTGGGAAGNNMAQIAGMVPGDVLVSIDAVTVSSAGALTSVLDRHYPGDVVELFWIDRAGQQHTGKAVLTS